ncbi:Rv1733c family protein [Streptomyces sp. NPDC002513]
MRRLPSVTVFRGPRVWWWRWRRNPLRRRSDVLEAWVVLTVWVVTVVGGVLTGLAATHSVEHGLARERAEWRPVVALLTRDAPKATTASGAGRVWADVRWTGTDGRSHAGQARAAAGSRAGAAVTVWTDGNGSLVTRPASPSAARIRAAMVGVLVGTSVATVPYLVGRIVRERLERRRMARWDASWARFGPMWGRKTG